MNWFELHTFREQVFERALSTYRLAWEEYDPITPVIDAMNMHSQMYDLLTRQMHDDEENDEIENCIQCGEDVIKQYQFDKENSQSAEAVIEDLKDVLADIREAVQL